MKNRLLLNLAVVLASAWMLIPVHAEVTMLRIAWSIDRGQLVDGQEVPRTPKISMPSATLKLKENQLAKVLHFFAIDGGEIDDGDETALEVTFPDGLKVLYTHAILYGGYRAPAGSSRTGIGLPAIVGPAELRLIVNYTWVEKRDNLGAICTIEVNGPLEIVGPANESKDGIQPPTVSAVVKPDQDGPVEVVLESSTDMEKTWQPAALGVYGETEKKRFFRIRAEPR